MNTEHKELKSEIMAAIESGKAKMRPRWHFLLFSGFALVGSLIVLFSMVYLFSLAMFFMRENGTWFAPSFGSRGWFAFFHSMPWLLLALLALFLALLEVLVRRYRFVYQKSLMTSALGIIFIAVFGGYALAQTSLHRQFMPRHGGGFFRIMLAPPHGETYRGDVLYVIDRGFVIYDDNGSGTTTIMVTRHTRLPYGADFSTGTPVVVVGDRVSTGTVEAFGVREVDNW